MPSYHSIHVKANMKDINFVKYFKHLSTNMGVSWGASDAPMMAPIKSPYYFLKIWWKTLTTFHCKPTSNIVYPSTLEICITNLLKLISLDLDHLPTPRPCQRPPQPPQKIILMPNIFNKNQHIYLQSMFRSSFQSSAYSFNMKYAYLTNIWQNWCLSYLLCHGWVDLTGSLTQ